MQGSVAACYAVTMAVLASVEYGSNLYTLDCPRAYSQLIKAQRVLSTYMVECRASI